MSKFFSPETGDFDRYFMTSTDLIDRYALGNLWVWGNNYYGQLGDNTTINRSSPVQTICGGTNWKTVSCGKSHTAAIKTDGTLWGWGYNLYGQLGDNTTINKSSPVQTICGGTNWKTVSGGNYCHTSAIKTDGTLWGWGYNLYGQLGDNTTINRSSPVQTICGGTNWKTVSCGKSHTAAIKTDGTLWGCGDNSAGQLGNNTTVNKSSPGQTICGGTDWKMVACGEHHIVAIKTDGTLWGWGYNYYGQLGNNTTVNKSSPVQTICGGTNWKMVSGGYSNTSAIKTDGTLWAWGTNDSGQLGNNTTVNKSSPVQTICGGTNWKMVACGNINITAIKTDGTLWTWGFNSSGQLGDNTTVNKSSPVQTICGGTDWKTVSSGNYCHIALRYPSEVYENFDPYKPQVSLHLPMTGANNSTTFTDVSLSPKTITRYGDTKISTTQSKWGAGSGYFDGNGDYLSLTTSTDFGFGTSDYTIECWIFTSTPDKVLLDTRSADGFGLFYIDVNGYTSYWDGTTPQSGTVVCTNEVWNHIAFCRSAGVLKLFINGTQDFSVANADDFGSTRPILVGKDYNSTLTYFTGYMQDLRITKGIARYTADFTPSYKPLPF